MMMSAGKQSNIDLTIILYIRDNIMFKLWRWNEMMHSTVSAPFVLIAVLMWHFW